MRLFAKEIAKPLKGLTVDERYSLLLLALVKAGLDEDAKARIVAALEREKEGLNNGDC